MKSAMQLPLLAVALALGCGASVAQNVKITPLGSHAGELCDRDRATIFEGPTGVRILYDAGHSVTGGDDARLVMIARMAAFIDAVKGRPVHLALSGRTMEFDGAAKCVRGG